MCIFIQVRLCNDAHNFMRTLSMGGCKLYTVYIICGV